MQLSCKTEPSLNKESISLKVKSLQTIEDKKAYLENIFFEYQMILNEEERIIRLYDETSPEFIESKKDKAKKDDFFLASISAYFENHGYPSRPEVGQYGSMVPLIVHVYASNNKGFNKDQFKYFYGAFRFNDIPIEYFLAYIQRYYEVNEGRPFVKNKVMNASEEIYAIMDAMNFDY